MVTVSGLKRLCLQAHLLYRLPRKSATIGAQSGWLDKEHVDHRVLLLTRTQDCQPALRYARLSYSAHQVV